MNADASWWCIYDDMMMCCVLHSWHTYDDGGFNPIVWIEVLTFMMCSLVEGWWPSVHYMTIWYPMHFYDVAFHSWWHNIIVLCWFDDLMSMWCDGENLWCVAIWWMVFRMSLFYVIYIDLWLLTLPAFGDGLYAILQILKDSFVACEVLLGVLYFCRFV